MASSACKFDSHIWAVDIQRMYIVLCVCTCVYFFCVCIVLVHLVFYACGLNVGFCTHVVLVTDSKVFSL